MAGRLGVTAIATLFMVSGGTPGWAGLMAGIAIAESGGWPTAKNPTDQHTNGSQGSWGLWQIGSTHGPGGFGTRTPAWVQSMLTPKVNAREAVALSNHGAYLLPWEGDPVWQLWYDAGQPTKPYMGKVKHWLALLGKGTFPTGPVTLGPHTGQYGATTLTPNYPGTALTPASLRSAGTINWAFANLANWVNIYSVTEYNAILSVAQALGKV